MASLLAVSPEKVGAAAALTADAPDSPELSRLQLQFERMPIACFVVDAGLRVLEWNRAAERVFGYGRAEVIGVNAYDLLVPPAGREHAEALLGRAMAGDAECHAVGEVVTRDRRIIFCDWRHTSLRHADGEVIGVMSIAQDVTAQKEAEGRLRTSEARLAEAQRLAHIGNWSYDPRRQELVWSDEIFRMFGLTPLEGGIANSVGRQYVHPDDLPTLDASFARVLEDHQPFESYWRALRVDGTERFVHTRAEVELDDAGRPVRVFGTTQDITDLRNAERALVESEAKFRTLADASPAMIWLLDGDASARYVNRRYFEFFGLAEEDVHGGGWRAFLHPDDAPAYLAQVLESIRGHRPMHCRTRARRRDGKWRWLESRALPHFGEDGRYLGHVGHSLDITDQIETTASLRESERNLAAELAGMARLQEVSTRLVGADDSTSLLEHIVDAAIAITAADVGHIQLHHPESGTLKIVASRGLGHEFLDAFAVVREGQGCCGEAMRLHERVVVEDVASDPLFARGHDVSVLLAAGVRAIQATPLVTRSGQLVGMLSTHYRSPRRPAGRDLRVLDLLARQAADWIERRLIQAEREELLERERHARAESERAARLKDEFLATLSHELRTPLSAILGWADVLRERIDDRERVRRGIDIIRRNAWSQAQLIEDLLDLSRVITGKMRLHVERVSLPAIIEAAIEAVRPAADARQIRLDSVIEPISEKVHGDAARLQQVLWNLLSNAVKFTPDGGRVHVVLARVESQLEVCVSDTGRGIAPHFLPHVFERFRQADSSAAREHGGLGIGLALVKEIAELHGGEVRAVSPGEGKGSTFTLRLPLAIIHADEEDRPHPRAPRSLSLLEGAEPLLDGVKVLIVDDEPDALDSVRHILEDRRAEVSSFGSVDEALAALEERAFDVLVSDIGMPRRDGYAFIAEVRRRGVTTPAAALTAFARSEDRTRALLSGYQAHLAKPLESSELVATIASLAGRIGRPADP
jgi:PAS domain S-box-containing protein